jgi:hypothetical protein
MHQAARAFLVVVGLALMVAGLVAIVNVPDAAAAGLWWMAIGGFFVVAVALERQRYRSSTAEGAGELPGPGGGETPNAPVEARFQPTAEVFIDPSSGHRMRVLVDPATGERRYVAEA